MKIGEGDENPNTLRNFSSYNIRILKSSSKRSKNTRGGGSRPFGKIPNGSRFFFSDGFPKSLSSTRIFDSRDNSNSKEQN